MLAAVTLAGDSLTRPSDPAAKIELKKPPRAARVKPSTVLAFSKGGSTWPLRRGLASTPQRCAPNIVFQYFKNVIFGRILVDSSLFSLVVF